MIVVKVTKRFRFYQLLRKDLQWILKYETPSLSNKMFYRILHRKLQILQQRNDINYFIVNDCVKLNVESVW